MNERNEGEWGDRYGRNQRIWVDWKRDYNYLYYPDSYPSCRFSNVRAEIEMIWPLYHLTTRVCVAKTKSCRRKETASPLLPRKIALVVRVISCGNWVIKISTFYADCSFEPRLCRDGAGKEPRVVGDNSLPRRYLYVSLTNLYYTHLNISAAACWTRDS